MKSRTLFATALILLTPLAVSAFQAQADQVRKGQLKNKSFTTGSLKITFISFNSSFTIPFQYDGINFTNDMSGYIYPIQVQVANTSDQFTTFDPQRLSVVGKDGEQSDIRGLIHPSRRRRADGRPLDDEPVAAEARRMAPKASITDWYDLTRRVRLPARVYYEDKLLVTIIE